jgi:hypothetical protein
MLDGREAGRVAADFSDDSADDAQARVAELERMVGRLTLELEAAKKASTIWASRSTKNGR